MVNCRLHGIGWVNKRANIRGSPPCRYYSRVGSDRNYNISQAQECCIYIHTHIYIIICLQISKLYIYTQYYSKFWLDSWYSWAVPRWEIIPSCHWTITSRTGTWSCNVRPPRQLSWFITPLTMVYGTQITIVTGKNLNQLYFYESRVQSKLIPCPYRLQFNAIHVACV